MTDTRAIGVPIPDALKNKNPEYLIKSLEEKIARATWIESLKPPSQQSETSVSLLKKELEKAKAIRDKHDDMEWGDTETEYGDDT